MPLYVALHLLLFNWQVLFNLSRNANIFSFKLLFFLERAVTSNKGICSLL